MNAMQAFPVTPERVRVVVVGNGMVGHRFCERLAEEDKTGRYRIIALGEEPRAAYDRVHLTQYFSERSADKLMLGSVEGYDRLGIELLLGTRAVHLDREEKVI